MRKENWPKYLEQTINEWKEKPFVWGKTDCLQFAVHCAASILDYDLFLKDNPYDRYSTQEESDEILLREYGGSVSGVFGSLFKKRQYNKEAQRGDIVICDWQDNTLCGVIDLSGHRVAVKSENGILYIPVRYVVSAWSVE